MAQTLTGRVLDENKAPVPGATIILLSWPDSTLVKGEVADADGRFGLVIPEKNTATDMRLRIQGLSMEPKMLKVANTDEDTKFGDLTMLSKTTSVGEVVVQGIKPIFEMDPEKLTFNVAQAINTQGLTALEVLRKAPGVFVDRDDNIILKGKTGVRVYINGRPSPLRGKDLANYLNSLPSTDIEAIELISNPGARYEANGAAGIINIKLKQNKALGFNGNFNAVIGQGTETYKLGIRIPERVPRYMVGTSLNYRKGKVGMSGGYNHFDVTNWNFQRHNRLQRAPDSLRLLGLASDTAYDPVAVQAFNRMLADNGNFNIDYTFNKHHSMGFNGNASRNMMKWESNSRTRIVPVTFNPITNQYDGDTIRVLTANSVIQDLNRNYTGGLWYKYQDTSGHVLDADISTSFHHIDKRNDLPNKYYAPGDATNLNGPLLYDVIYRMVMPSTLSLSVGKIDYTTPILPTAKLGGTLTTGVRVNLVQTKNTFEYWADTDPTPGITTLLIDPQRSNKFNYTERVSAGYATYAFGIENFKFNLGARVEHTYTGRHLTTAQAIANKDRDTSYLNLFPSGGVTWELSKKHTLGLNYSRRIERPSYGDLNPFENKLDELTYQKGNPFLKPQYIDNVELQHTFMGMINTSVGYSHTRDLFAEIVLTDTSRRRNFITNQNLATRDMFSMNLATPFQITKWWNGFISANGYHDQYSGHIPGNLNGTLQVWSYSGYMQNTIRFAKGWTFEASGYYNSPNIWGGTFRNAKFWGVDVGFKRRFMQDRATLGLSCSDIFLANRWRGVSDYGNTRVVSNGGWDSRVIRLTLNVSFGNTKLGRGQQRKSAVSDLNERAGAGGGR